MDKDTARKFRIALVIVAIALICIGMWGIVSTSTIADADSVETVAADAKDGTVEADATEETEDASSEELVEESVSGNVATAQQDAQNTSNTAVTISESIDQNNGGGDAASSAQNDSQGTATQQKPESTGQETTSTGAGSSTTADSNHTTFTVTQSVNGGAAKNVTVATGSTVLDVLAASGVAYVNQASAYGAYITSIAGVAADANHGWTYSVNGVEPMTACSNYKVSAGDAIVWNYVEVG